jgi:hypothetical protein
MLSTPQELSASLLREKFTSKQVFMKGQNKKELSG